MNERLILACYTLVALGHFLADQAWWFEAQKTSHQKSLIRALLWPFWLISNLVAAAVPRRVKLRIVRRMLLGLPKGGLRESLVGVQGRLEHADLLERSRMLVPWDKPEPVALSRTIEEGADPELSNRLNDVIDVLIAELGAYDMLRLEQMPMAGILAKLRDEGATHVVTWSIARQGERVAGAEISDDHRLIVSVIGRVEPKIVVHLYERVVGQKYRTLLSWDAESVRWPDVRRAFEGHFATPFDVCEKVAERVRAMLVEAMPEETIKVCTVGSMRRNFMKVVVGAENIETALILDVGSVVRRDHASNGWSVEVSMATPAASLAWEMSEPAAENDDADLRRAIVLATLLVFGSLARPPWFVRREEAQATREPGSADGA